MNHDAKKFFLTFHIYLKLGATAELILTVLPCISFTPAICQKATDKFTIILLCKENWSIVTKQFAVKKLLAQMLGVHEALDRKCTKFK